jgi:hypothetical protein
VICTGPRTCTRTGHKGKREKGSVGKPGFYVAACNKGGKQKVGILEDTIMIEKDARKRAGHLRDTCGKQTEHRQLVLPVPLPLGQSLRYPEGDPTRFEKGEPERLGRHEAVCETSSQVGRRDARRSLGRERGVSTVGDLFGDLKLEGLDAAQMNDLGGVTDEILAAQMEILAENEVFDSGEDTVGEDLEDEE